MSSMFVINLCSTKKLSLTFESKLLTAPKFSNEAQLGEGNCNKINVFNLAITKRLM